MGFSLTSWIITVCDSWQWIVTNFSSLSWLEVCQVTSNPQSRTSRMLKVFGPIKTNLWDRSHKFFFYRTGPSLWGTSQTFMGLVRQKSIHMQTEREGRARRNLHQCGFLSVRQTIVLRVLCWLKDSKYCSSRSLRGSTISWDRPK